MVSSPSTPRTVGSSSPAVARSATCCFPGAAGAIGWRRSLGRIFVRLGKKLTKISFQPRIRSINQGYARWIKRHEPAAAELERQRHTLFTASPKISVLTVLHQPTAEQLSACLESLASQTYPQWELCLAIHNASTAVRQTLTERSRRDPSIRVHWLDADLGEAANENAALALATGELIVRLGQSDTLAPFALYEVARVLVNEPQADVLYSDEDRLGPRGRENALFKPDWSPDLLRSHNYIGNLVVLRRALLHAVGGFRPGYEGATGYDLVLRCTEKARRIVHVPGVLYHTGAGMVASAAGQSPGILRAVQEHLQRQGVAGETLSGSAPATCEVRYRHEQQPLISIIIPNKDYAEGLTRCVQSIGRSTYRRHEILIVENNSVHPETRSCYNELCRSPGVRVVEWQHPFNYSALNNWAVSQAAGEVVLFLNNDMEVISADWLERMLEHALRPEVGAVGAKLHYADQTVQHAGVVIGLREILGHVHRHFPRADPGYANRLAVVQNFSAVTAACLMTRRAVFEEVGGFDEEFGLDFNDIDLCLRLGRRGYRIVWTPYAELYHFESKTRGYAVTTGQQVRFMRETHLFQTQWSTVFRDGDPYYNPNLTRATGKISRWEASALSTLGIWGAVLARVRENPRSGERGYPKSSSDNRPGVRMRRPAKAGLTRGMDAFPAKTRQDLAAPIYSSRRLIPARAGPAGEVPVRTLAADRRPGSQLATTGDGAPQSRRSRDLARARVFARDHRTAGHVSPAWPGRRACTSSMSSVAISVSSSRWP